MKRLASLALSVLAFQGAAAQTATVNTDPPSLSVADTSYVTALKAKLRNNVLYAGPLDGVGNPTVTFRVLSSPAGEVVSVDRVHSSGLTDFDAAVERAIWKSSPLPERRDGKVEQVLVIAYALKEE